MKKQNMTLASEVLMYQQKRTRFWFIAFVVTLAVSVVSHVLKGGAR